MSNGDENRRGATGRGRTTSGDVVDITLGPEGEDLGDDVVNIPLARRAVRRARLGRRGIEQSPVAELEGPELKLERGPEEIEGPELILKRDESLVDALRRAFRERAEAKPATQSELFNREAEKFRKLLERLQSERPSARSQPRRRPRVPEEESVPEPLRPDRPDQGERGTG